MWPNGSDSSKGTTPPPVADTASLEAAVRRLEARINADSTPVDLLSRLAVIERAYEGIQPHDKTVVNAINLINKHLADVQSTVGRQLAPSKKIPGFTVADERVIEIITSAFADIMKADDAKRDRELADLRAEFTSIALQMKSCVERLSAVANAQAITAAEKLCSAARFFSSSPIGKSAGGAKGEGIVENSILKGVAQ